MNDITIKDNILYYQQLKLNFPAVKVSIAGKIYEPKLGGKEIAPLTYCYQVEDLTFIVKVELLPSNVLRKIVTIQSPIELPTCDWVESDSQTIPDTSVTRRGYVATCSIKSSGAEDEGVTGQMPTCGYPLIGEHFFVGSEHPATFNQIVQKSENNITYVVRQHPIWTEEKTINLAPVVISWSSNGNEAFFNYFNEIRTKVLDKPFFSMCTFWSDPYAGDGLYLTDKENYNSFIKAFNNLGIKPSAFTLDCGWQEKESIFQPGKSFNGMTGFKQFCQSHSQDGNPIGLWASYNGPIGLSIDYLKSQGIQIGIGNGSQYGGTLEYGVLLDKKLEDAIGNVLVEYAKMGVIQFKLDWDNECASNESFNEKYPTVKHVRENSIDAMIRIIKRLKEVNPNIVIRSGWWPSPWWLMHVNHVFLSDSNDSEYTSWPSRTQRDSAATYRDTMYYCHFVRDHNAIPLDVIDNHEFAHAQRNPFHEEIGTTSDIMMLAIMRGTSYFPLTLQPEAMEVWLVDLLKKMMSFANCYGKNLYNAKSSMFGGNPNEGKVYGFRYDLTENCSWILLRNPSAMANEFTLDNESKDGIFIYPYFDSYKASNTITFAPHEVKVLILDKEKLELPFDTAFQAVAKENDLVDFYFPAHIPVENIQPAVGKLYRIDNFEYEVKKKEAIDGGLEVMFRLRLPYKMRQTTINVTVETTQPRDVKVLARLSRSANDNFSCAQLPVSEFSFGLPGIGENKNPELNPTCPSAQFAIPCAEGGDAWYSLFIYGVDNFNNIDISVSGFYAPSEKALTKKWTPSFLEQLPPQHPHGFAMVEKISF